MLQEFLDKGGYTKEVHACLMAICEEYRISALPSGDDAPELNFDPGNRDHMILLQNKVSNTPSTNPHNHPGGEPGQRLPRGQRGSNVGAAGHRIKTVAGAAAASSNGLRHLPSRQQSGGTRSTSRTLDPLLPLHIDPYMVAGTCNASWQVDLANWANFSTFQTVCE